jgi:hypothetical protein
VLTTPAGSLAQCSANQDDLFADYSNGCELGLVSARCVDHFDFGFDRGEEICTVVVTGALRCTFAHFYYPDQVLGLDPANTGCRRDT